MNNKLVENLKKSGAIAIVRNIPFELIPNTICALIDGGISAIEITLNREDSYKSIKWVSENKKEVLIGAGTVLTVEQVNQAAQSGAQYVISPNMCSDVIIETKRLNLVSIPGCVTPTEMTTAIYYGADMIKLFPASVFGPEYVKALLAPFPELDIVAVGGINIANIRFYKRAGVCAFGIGGSLVDPQVIKQGKFESIKDLAKAYVDEINK